MLKDFFRSTFSYINAITDPNVSIFPLKYLLAVLVAAEFPVFLVLPPCCPRFDKYVYLFLSLVPAWPS